MLSMEARLRWEKRLRKKLLMAISIGCKAAPSGLLPARRAMDDADGLMGEGQRFGDGVEETPDRHALRLIRDLVAAGLAREQLLTIRRGQSFGVDFLKLAITDAGELLLQEQGPVHPLVDDERIAE